MDFKCTARLEYREEGGFTVVVGRTPLVLPVERTAQESRDGLALTSRALSALYLDPRPDGGNDVWVLCTWDIVTGDLSPSHHDLHLVRSDPRPHNLVWSNPVRSYGWWETGGKSTRIIRFIVRPTDLDPWWDRLGPPDGRGSWLASLLPPPTRRVPCGVRLYAPAAPLQVWLKL